ncbi:MAG: TetR/AcrR family transcriptional regulator [Xanthobacteraceae bacterium]|nr:TetR/AcrR family transcriptional regulator [Xanthobacteraceae bacterium]QYK45124.1 MAG: TetR/AcrR family transcriptional regulator [Xanthobacteraceae bacterium]
MRNSRETAAKNRERIVAAAAKLFRERGIASVGVAELMEAAGMTHGGFYKHFESKDALVAEACAWSFGEPGGGLRAAAEAAKPGEELKVIVDRYLSRSHRDNPGKGCAVAALGSEAANRESPAREAVAAGRERLVSLVARYLKGANAKERASAFVALMVGALVHARLADGAGSDAVLRAAKRELYQRIEEQG